MPEYTTPVGAAREAFRRRDGATKRAVIVVAVLRGLRRRRRPHAPTRSVRRSIFIRESESINGLAIFFSVAITQPFVAAGSVRAGAEGRPATAAAERAAAAGQPPLTADAERRCARFHRSQGILDLQELARGAEGRE